MPLGGGLCVAHLAIADWWHLKSFGFLRFLASRLQIQQLRGVNFCGCNAPPKMFAPRIPISIRLKRTVIPAISLSNFS